MEKGEPAAVFMARVCVSSLTLRYRQSSEPTSGWTARVAVLVRSSGPICGHHACCTVALTLYDALPGKATGGRHRREPRGGRAYGTPVKTVTEVPAMT